MKKVGRITFLALFIVSVGGVSAVLGKLSGSLSEEAIEARLTPDAKVHVKGGIKKKKSDKAQGPEGIYNANCKTCHKRGTAGAPKLGDKAAWEPRIGRGMETLYDHVWNGFKAMPRKGNCLQCTEDDIRQTIEFMLKSVK